MRRLSRVLERRLSRALEPAGITAAQFSILVAVSVSEEVSITALAEAIDMSQSSLSRQLAAMRRRGWVGTTGGVGRARQVRLTKKGNAVFERALPEWHAA